MAAYEAEVMHILAEHGGRLISASHPTEPMPDDPDEIHIVQFDGQRELDAFRADPRHAALKDRRISALRDTRLYITDQFITYLY